MHSFTIVNMSITDKSLFVAISLIRFPLTLIMYQPASICDDELDTFFELDLLPRKT